MEIKNTVFSVPVLLCDAGLFHILIPASCSRVLSGVNLFLRSWLRSGTREIVDFFDYIKQGLSAARFVGDDAGGSKGRADK